VTPQAQPFTVAPSPRLTVPAPIQVPPRATAGVFLFAGGGTGGHIFPALAISEEITRLDPAARSIFLCSDRPLDAEILRRAPVDFRVVPAKPFGLFPGRLIRFAGSWGAAIRTVRAAIRDARKGGGEPTLVAMGGFVAAPAAQAARAERCPVVLVNLDAVPGKANRWIARRAERVFTAAPVAKAGRWTEVPPIVRSSARTGRDPAECRSRLGLDPQRPTLLVTGGSQGARSINTLIARLLGDQPALFAGWQVIHQCGRDEEQPARAAFDAARIPAIVRAFIDEMGMAWGAADLAVSRAGAGSVAEAWANGVPTLFLPYPYHRDEHQRANTEVLVRAGAAIVAKDRIDPAHNLADAGKTLADLIRDSARRVAMRVAFAGLGPADGAERVARALLKAV
jgi:UDP-N-acetylglucosamine--N-acetylmuramyl-(pentapeptide) pyrophosphoryl-undecaprenol N-acetylglucosamine transferase